MVGSRDSGSGRRHRDSGDRGTVGVVLPCTAADGPDRTEDRMRILVATIALMAFGCAPSMGADSGIPVYGYQVVHTYPHDPGAFTEGLFYENGFLYESTGVEGHSSLRKVKLETGAVVQKFDWPAEYF